MAGVLAGVVLDCCHSGTSRDGVDIIVKRATLTSTDSLSSPMSHFNVYRDQLASLSQGSALWNPSPLKKIYEKVSIGDVGYLHEGTFIRMFNVTLPWDDPSNRKLGVPEKYESLDCGPFCVERDFVNVEHYSRCVTPEPNAGNQKADSPEQ